MAIADYELYERLKPKLGEEETRALLERFDRFERELPERVRREAATKADLQELRAATQADLLRLEATTKVDFQRLEATIQQLATKAAVQRLEATIERLATKEELQELREEFLKFKVELIERIHGLERQFHELERRLDRLLYTVILLFFIFNGDKVFGLIQGLLRLTGK